MKAYYDSEADAVSIDLVPADRWDDQLAVDDTYCHVAVANGRAVNIEFLGADKALAFVREAAAAAEIDPQFITAAIHAVIAAPDRDVTLEFSEPFSDSESLVA